MLRLRLQSHPLPLSAIGHTAGVPERRALWCGRGEGWLTQAEFIRRTEEAIARYASAQPLRFRLAMQGARSGFYRFDGHARQFVPDFRFVARARRAA